MRKTYEDSCKVLTAQGLLEEGIPPLPLRRPSYDDEEPLGVSFFRTHLEDADLSELSLPRTFFGKSLVARCRFVGTDLSESCLCWNDFEDCDFSGASLVGSDLRASNYDRCRFDDADLSGADLRGLRLEGCSFRGARMEGAVLIEEQLRRGDWTPEQRAGIRLDAEDEPPGG